MYAIICSTMFVRKSTVKQGDTSYTYLQLVHNYRNKATGKVKTEVLCKLGREDKISSAFVADIISALAPYSDPAGAVAPAEETLAFVCSREYGGIWVLDALWKRLGMAAAVKKILAQRQFRLPVERMLFSLVASRILRPSSKLSLEHWVANKVFIPDLREVDVHNLYRVMDLLAEEEQESHLQHAVFTQVAKETQLDVDLIFLDTTNTYFECAVSQEESGLLKRGRSKDNHPELPLVSIAFAVTRTGIPIRCWVFPGNTSDQRIVADVKKDLGSWNLGKVIMVQDAGFNSAENRKVLVREAGDFIIGEKLRLGSPGTAVEALHRKGRYKTLENGLQIKDVVIDAGRATERRFVIVKNPDAEKRDQQVRQDILAEVENRLYALKQLEGKAHTKAACALRSHSTFGRYIKQSKRGILSINKAKIASERLLDGKFLVSTSNMSMDAADVAMGYKQLFEIERVFKDMKHVLDLRPIYHRLDERIRSHILICWMGMVVVRYAEQTSGMSWHRIQKACDEITVGLIETPSAKLWHTSRISEEAAAVCDALSVKLPPKIAAVEPGNL